MTRKEGDERIAEIESSIFWTKQEIERKRGDLEFHLRYGNELAVKEYAEQIQKLQNKINDYESELWQLRLPRVWDQPKSNLSPKPEKGSGVSKGNTLGCLVIIGIIFLLLIPFISSKDRTHKKHQADRQILKKLEDIYSYYCIEVKQVHDIRLKFLNVKYNDTDDIYEVNLELPEETELNLHYYPKSTREKKWEEFVTLSQVQQLANDNNKLIKIKQYGPNENYYSTPIVAAVIVPEGRALWFEQLFK